MSNSGSGGCLAQIVGMVLIFCVLGIVELCQNSQVSLIKKARKQNSMDNYEWYLDKYPTGRYSREAYDSIVALWDKIDINKPDGRFHADYKYQFVRIYDELIQEYHNAHFIDTMNYLMKMKCETLYKKAFDENTLDSWDYYIESVPEQFVFDAREELQSRYDELWGTEVRAWETACKQNLAEAYENYLKLYPDGKHHAEAEKKAIQLGVDKVFGGSHGDLPAMEKTTNGSGAYASVVVKNATGYALTLMYSGNDCKRVTIPSYGRETIRLKNGEYRITATVNASNVIPYAGVENLNGGGYEIEYYIQTVRY